MDDFLTCEQGEDLLLENYNKILLNKNITIMAGIKTRKVTDVFNGQSDIVLFDAPADGYSDSTSLGDVTATGMSLGQIVEESTSWDGDEPSIDSIKDEQGEAIIAQVTGGTYAFSCDVADLSAEMAEAIMKAAKVTTPGTSTGIGNLSNVVKFVELPVSTRPIAIFNDEANKWILFPKAKIAGNLTLDSKLWRIHLIATAEYIDTATLGTFMMGNGTPTYETTAP